MFRAWPIDYYGSTDQSEWAADILFRGSRSLAGLYPRLVQHGLTTFLSPGVMRFLGRNVPANGNIPARLQADVSQAANTRYLKALASADDPTPLGRLTTRLAQPVPINSRRARALNPHAPADARVLETLSRGEFTISAFPSRHVNVAKRRVNGFRNRDLRALLFADAQAAPPDQQRHAASVSRQLALLRAHGLVRKVHGTHRYHLTTRGRVIVTALISLRNVGTDTLTKLVA